MNAHTHKTPEDTHLQRTNVHVQGPQNTSASIIDHRPEAVTQRQIQALADSSEQALQLQRIQQFIHSSPQVQQSIQLQKVANNSFPIQKMELEEEELLQGKFKSIQRMELEEEELMQGKFQTIQRQENNTGLPDSLKSGIEQLSGHTMDDVQVHYNSDKPAQLNAHAYAQGTNIHLASGQEKHLPHEAWHVVQQKQGRVKPTLQLKAGVNINDEKGLEKEADIMGAKALQQPAQKKEEL